ncbi:dTDP-4-dehydrorhamnose reductase [Comamonas sp.]|uniref:dTDP-4-dehydrorhamnose reductase n=1 Tax=Comamonas sp. TaxID=34028 RepID=UPI003A94C767
MKILLLGKNGQIGWELQRSLAPLGEVIALGRSAEEGLCGDLADLQRLQRTLRFIRPDVIVNAAAHTAVDKAESEPDLAHCLNALAPELLATEAKSLGALLVHYSTDYVFDGCGMRPWVESDVTAPLSVYGRTKLEGEQRIQASGCKHLIFRISWVYAARGGNFAKTILRLAQERDELSVIDDQWGAPTGADLIADVTAHAIRQAMSQKMDLGLYHLAASGETNWHNYASYLIGEAQRVRPDIGWKVGRISAVPAMAFLRGAQRPLNSRLDTRKLAAAMQLRLPAWQHGVDRFLYEVLCL